MKAYIQGQPEKYRDLERTLTHLGFTLITTLSSEGVPVYGNGARLVHLRRNLVVLEIDDVQEG
jgi:hypothetical protein